MPWTVDPVSARDVPCRICAPVLGGRAIGAGGFVVGFGGVFGGVFEGTVMTSDLGSDGRMGSGRFGGGFTSSIGRAGA
ncbi:MAG TPA: hypothetical protein VF424_09440, partial [Vicinamibacterales bacterium]